MHRWTDTEQLHHLVKRFASQAEGSAEKGALYAYPVIRYAGKVKLHGTNAGVQIDPDGTVTPQGRNRVLTEADSNQGFWHWANQHRAELAKWATDVPIVVYGEWCGPSIQKGTALSSLKRKMFCIFAVHFETESGPKIRHCPDQISRQLGNVPQDCYILPYWTTGLRIDFGDRGDVQRAADIINNLTSEVERCDPWVKAVFGHEGIGEGLVWYPQVPDLSHREHLTGYMFKSKGEKHRGVKQKTPAQVDPQKASSINEFVQMVVTEPRLEQGLAEVGGIANMKHTADFMRWVSADIQKECTDELNASGLTWKDVAKLISSQAVQWFKQKAEQI